MSLSALVGSAILGVASLGVAESGRRLLRARELWRAEALSRHRAERTRIECAPVGVPLTLEGVIRAEKTLRSPLGDAECVLAIVTARLDVGDGSEFVELGRAGVPFAVVDESGSVSVAGQELQLVAEPDTVFHELTPAQRAWVEARLGAKVRHLATCEEALLRPGQRLLAVGQLRASDGQPRFVGDAAGPTLITQTEAQLVAAADAETVTYRALVLAGRLGFIVALAWAGLALLWSRIACDP